MLVQVGCFTVGLTAFPSTARCNVETRNCSVDVKVDTFDGISVDALLKDVTIASNVVNINTAASVTAALVCMVHGSYELFYVDDEPLVVTDGYFMVRTKS